MEDDYHSSSDSDFDDAVSSASSAGDAVRDQDVELGSGDEGVIAVGKKRAGRRKKGLKGKSQQVDSGEEDAEGIRVRLRSGRGGSTKQTRQLAPLGASTANIDAIWARMNDPLAAVPQPLPEAPALPSPPEDPASLSSQSTIAIPHTYTFAGETHTSTKTVPLNSPEAVAYLEKQKEGASTPSQQGPALRRPLARKGLLDPNPSVLVNGVSAPPRADLPPSIGGHGARHLTAETTVAWNPGMKRKDVSLNTVEKSKLDWQQEVDRQGLRDELDQAEKSGQNYLHRMDFLDRAESAREQQSRAGRLAIA